jgi:hypothetical protein
MKKNKDYLGFIEKYFKILDKDSQQPVPFVLNSVQKAYYDMLQKDYFNLEGVRDIVLKARQEGMSSFILALFTVDFLLTPYSVSICISHRKDSTDLLFKKVKFYIDSYCDATGINPQALLKSDNKNFIENAQNGAYFYIGTAGAKVGGRGGSAKNILFSECAFYQDTELITAQEIVVATAQQVPQYKGMIFIESTANGLDNYYQQTWEQAEQGTSTYKPRFFGWREFYTEEWIEAKRKEFPTDAMWKQEYPETPEDAFITTGSPYFDNQILKAMLDISPEPLFRGKFSPDGQLDELTEEENPSVYVYREPEYGEQFVVFADPADSKDFCAAVACSKKNYDFPIVFNAVMESSQFGYELNNMCKYIERKTGMYPKLAVERNTGQATIYVLKQLNYPDLFRMIDFTSTNSHEGGGVGWVTTGHLSGGELQGTRRKMLDDLALVIKQSGNDGNYIKIYDKAQIKQMMGFMVVKGRAQAKSNKKDDLVMATAGAWQVQLLTPSNDFGDWDPEENAKKRELWRFK